MEVLEIGTAEMSSIGTIEVSWIEGKTGIIQGTVETGEKVIVGDGVITKGDKVFGGIAGEGAESALELVANAERI